MASRSHVEPLRASACVTCRHGGNLLALHQGVDVSAVRPSMHSVGLASFLGLAECPHVVMTSFFDTRRGFS